MTFDEYHGRWCSTWNETTKRIHMALVEAGFTRAILSEGVAGTCVHDEVYLPYDDVGDDVVIRACRIAMTAEHFDDWVAFRLDEVSA